MFCFTRNFSVIVCVKLHKSNLINVKKPNLGDSLVFGGDCIKCDLDLQQNCDLWCVLTLHDLLP